jgi:flagellar basal body-associated protein FliL
MGPENTNQPFQTPPPMHEEKSIGPAIGIIVIIAVIALGGLYFWGQRVEKQKEMTPPTSEATTTNQTSQNPEFDANMQAMQSQSSSDDVGSIEADLNSTNLTSLGSEATTVNTAAAAGAAQ